MTTLTIDELQDKPRLKALMEAGEIIELREADRIVGRILPVEPLPAVSGPQPVIQWPDFEARHRELFGDRVLNAVDEFLEDRHGRY